MMFTDYEEAWELKPRKLTAEEVNSPGKVVDEFFQLSHMPAVRTHMWEGFKAMVSGNYHQLKPGERVKLITFYEHTVRLMEAVHLIYAERRMTGR